ncbi:galactose mutarotase-like [Bacillus rossius redtenbacheri]|uniref:galactose mutarotase-like n=1 Tax=Bacillus rossius redtenbacheri TaxID=93214 RepID=UPI002FDCE328
MLFDPETSIVEDGYGSIFDNETGNQVIVRRYTLTNSAAMAVQVISYGATLASVCVPDADGVVNEVTLGFDDLEGYLANGAMVGATVGRVANRVSNGSFRVDGVEHCVPQNEGTSSLHGGPNGFDKAVWRGHLEGGKVLVMSLLSPDGDAGYPGDLLVNARYFLTTDNALVISTTATCSRKTPVSLTSHPYFNLAGHEAGPKGLFEHEVCVNASRYLATNQWKVPTGELRRAEGVMDLRVPQVMGKAIPLVAGGGYDHTFVLDRWGGDWAAGAGEGGCGGGGGGGVQFAARVVHPPTGRTLDLLTDQACLQLYTGSGLPELGSPGALTGRSGVAYDAHGGLCLEPHGYVDAVNHPHFPDPVLRPGQLYRHVAVYRFGVTKKAT